MIAHPPLIILPQNEKQHTANDDSAEQPIVVGKQRRLGLLQHGTSIDLRQFVWQFLNNATHCGHGPAPS
jgi:hypothetical protein